MSAPPEPVALRRFGRTSRWVHGSVGVLTLICLATAAVLYNSSLAVAVGSRDVVTRIHVYSGYALAVPLLLGPLARSYRADLRRLNRFTPRDWQWLRSRDRRTGAIRVGKYNAGQKLNAALSAGGLGVLLLTGTVMHQTGLTSLAARTGATFVHDWAALCLGLLVLGHLTHAVFDAGAMLGMRTGWVSLSWARREHAEWADEVLAQGDDVR